MLHRQGQGELQVALQSCGAVELDARWHIIEPGYHDMLFEVMILTAIQNGWEFPNIPLGDMVQELQNDNFDPRQVSQVPAQAETTAVVWFHACGAQTVRAHHCIKYSCPEDLLRVSLFVRSLSLPPMSCRSCQAYGV